MPGRAGRRATEARKGMLCSMAMVNDKMYIVTGRQDVAREQTERWVEMYFPQIFDDVILMNSFTNEIAKWTFVVRYRSGASSTIA